MDAVTLAAASAAARKRYGSQPVRYQRGLVPCVTRVQGAMSFEDQSHSLSDGTTQTSFQRLKVTVTTAASDLRMVLGNFSWGAAGPNQITVTAAFETGGATNPTGGAVYPLTFGGKLAAVLDPDAQLISDPGCFPLAVQPGDTLWLRTYVSVGTLGQKWPLAAHYWQTGDGTATTDLTSSASGNSGLSLSNVYVRAFAPAAVLGVPASPTLPVFAIWGDSELVSLNDWFADLYRGWAERAMAGQYSYTNVSRHTSHVSQMVASPAVGSGSAFAPLEYRQRWRVAIGATHVLSGFGVNDLGSDTLAVVQANLLAHWTDVAGRGMKIWQYTLPPRTTSTDAWTTIANQTVLGTETSRVTLNTWIRAGAPIDPTSKAAVAVGTGSALVAGQSGHPLKGYIETADSWETARNSGKWKVSDRSVTDAAITSGAGVLTSSTAAFAAADVGKTVAVPGAGTSGGVLVTQITSRNSSTSVNVLNNASTTVSAATAYIGMWTSDGLHPSKSGHVAAGAALVAAVATIATS